MHTDRGLALIGAGGHSLVVADAWVASGRQTSELCLFDQDSRKTDTQKLGLTVRLLTENNWTNWHYHVCVGNNAARLALGKAIQVAGAEPCSIVHPKSQIALSAIVADGCFIALNAIVGPQARIGPFTIVNHAAIVDHECEIGAGCHLAPATVLGGSVKVGDGVFIGANATVLPGVRIGDDAIIGAGAVVLHDIPPATTYVGNPAREVKRT